MGKRAPAIYTKTCPKASERWTVKGRKTSKRGGVAKGGDLKKRGGEVSWSEASERWED